MKEKENKEKKMLGWRKRKIQNRMKEKRREGKITDKKNRDEENEQ